MNFLFVPYIEQVPEWRDIFYSHHQVLEKFIDLINQSTALMNEITEKEQKNSNKSLDAYKKQKQKLNEMIIIQCVEMSNHCDNEQSLISVFIWFKIYQIECKYQTYLNLMKVIGRDDHDLQLLFENLYIETYYLNTTVSYNFASYLSITKNINQEIEKIYGKFRILTKIKRLRRQTRKLLAKIELTYVHRNRQMNENLEYAFQKQLKQKKKTQLQSTAFGLLMGFVFGFLAITIIVIITNNLSLHSNETFANDFPAWRGSAELVFYMWILSLNMLFYEKSNINYKLIFHFQRYNLPRSSFLFLMASIFTFIWLLLLVLQTLQFAGVIKTRFQSFPELFWLIFLVYILNPLPIFHSKGRFYVIRLLFKSLFSIFFPMNFLIIWFSEQMVSLTQPITDFFYTCCYFFSKDLQRCKALTPNFNSGIVIGFFLLRMYQNMKFFIQQTNQKPDKKYDFWSPPFLGFCRASTGAIAATMAIFNRLKSFPAALPLWIVFISITTLVSWYVDVRGDWGLLNHQTRIFLRKKLLFPQAKFLYIFMGIFNLFLRVGWVLTIAPFVINSTGVWPLLFVMIVSFIQIFRRGVWNTLRIENQHIKNCEAFQATIKDDHILKIALQKAEQLKKKYNENNKNDNVVSSKQELMGDAKVQMAQQTVSQEKLLTMRHKKQQEYLKEILRVRKKRKQKSLNFIQKQKKELDKIQDQLDDNIFQGVITSLKTIYTAEER